MSAAMSFICEENNKGPRTVPCGTPDACTTSKRPNQISVNDFREERIFQGSVYVRCSCSSLVYLLPGQTFLSQIMAIEVFKILNECAHRNV